MADVAPEVRQKNQIDQTLMELECPLCYNTFNQPRTLSCLHTYCESCLQKVRATSSSSQVLSCPECRTETKLTAGGVKDLPINFKLKTISEIITMEQCHNITRRRSSVFSGSDLMCAVHQEKPKEYFCISCETVICITCVIEQHREHEDVKHVSEVSEQHVKELEKIIPQMNEAISNGELMLDSLKADFSNLDKALSNEISSMDIYFTNIRKVLDGKEKMIANEMKIPVDREVKESQEHIVRLTQALEGLEKSKQLLEHALDKKSEDEKQLFFQIDAGITHVEDEIFHSDYTSFYPTPFVLGSDLKDQCLNLRYNTESSATSKSSTLSLSKMGRQPKVSRVLTLPVINLMSSKKPFRKSTSHFPFSISSEILPPVFVIEAKGLIGLDDERTLYPNSVCCLTEDTFLVTDSYNHLFRIIESTGKCLQTVGSMGRGDGQFYEPMGIALDLDGNTLVLDGKGTGRIQKFSTEGNFLSKFKVQEMNAPPYMEEPIDLVLLANGDILVTDSAKSCVHNFNASGKYNGAFGNFIKFKQPSGIAASETRVVIADMAKHCLFIFDQHGKFIRQVGKRGVLPGELYIPYGVAICSDGYIVVSESGNHRISVFSPCARFIRCFGGHGSEKGRLMTPRGICFNHHAELVVCDEENQRLQLFRRIK